MNKNCKITIDLPEDLFAVVERFQEKSNIPDTEAAVFELLRYALTLPPYFLDFDWPKAEAEADADVAAGRIRRFSSVEVTLVDMKS